MARAREARMPSARFLLECTGLLPTGRSGQVAEGEVSSIAHGGVVYGAHWVVSYGEYRPEAIISVNASQRFLVDERAFEGTPVSGVGCGESGCSVSRDRREERRAENPRSREDVWFSDVVVVRRVVVLGLLRRSGGADWDGVVEDFVCSCNEHGEGDDCGGISFCVAGDEGVNEDASADSAEHVGPSEEVCHRLVEGRTRLGGVLWTVESDVSDCGGDDAGGGVEGGEKVVRHFLSLGDST